MNVIEVNNVRKSFKRFEALRGVTFSVKKGEIYGFLGPNGAGKSTTINILAGLLEHDSGEVHILGKPIKDVKHDINVATAYHQMIGILSVRQNLRVFARMFNVKNVEQRVDEMLETFELKHLQHAKSYTLSSGENTRLNLCKGFINHPKVLLLDECTVGLDPDIARKTRDVIRRFQRDHGTTILFTSHQMQEVEELCDRIAFIFQGKILHVGTVRELKQLIRGQIVEIDFVPPVQSLVEFFRKRDIPLISHTADSVQFHIESSEQLQFLMYALSKHNFTIRDMTIKKPSLDDVFIKIARGEL